MGSMILSFPMSFYYSRLTVIDKANASQYIKRNMVMSISCMGLFAYTLYRKN